MRAQVAEAQGAREQARWLDLRREGPSCEAGDAALMALAAGLVGWHAANAFCGATGRPLAALQGGHARRAPAAPCAAWRGMHSLHGPCRMFAAACAHACCACSCEMRLEAGCCSKIFQ